MKKLILNPEKISLKKKETYVFLGEWFLHYIKKNLLKKINYEIFKTKKFNLKRELVQAKENQKLYREIISELYPKLNQLHQINWNLKTWNFFLGHWLTHFISVIYDRFELIEAFKNKKNIDFSEQLIIGKSAGLATYNLKDFTFNAGLIRWNEKLISRIMYLLFQKDFGFKNNLNQSANFLKQRKENFFEKINYKFKMIFLKFIFFFVNNNFIFYHSYIADKYKLFKIYIKLKCIPVKYSFDFFDKKLVKKNINFSLRQKIKLNITNEKNLKKKITKFLIAETIPTIYLEGFKEQMNYAIFSHLPKKVYGVFTSSAYQDNSFKFWLAKQIQKNTKIYIGQHGAGYNIYKNLFEEKFDLSFSDSFFVWGKKKFNKKVISIGNFLINKKNLYKKNNFKYNKALIILSAPQILKRISFFHDRETFDQDIQGVQNILDNINRKIIPRLDIRKHPQDKRRDLNFIDFLNFDSKSNNVLNAKENFESVANRYSILIFSYFSTEFFKYIALNKPCLIYLNSSFFNKFLKKENKSDFIKLKTAKILFTSGKKLAKHLNKIFLNTDKWWNKKEVKSARYKFCQNYSELNFNSELLLKKIKP